MKPATFVFMFWVILAHRIHRPVHGIDNLEFKILHNRIISVPPSRNAALIGETPTITISKEPILKIREKPRFTTSEAPPTTVREESKETLMDQRHTAEMLNDKQTATLMNPSPNPVKQRESTRESKTHSGMFMLYVLFNPYKVPKGYMPHIEPPKLVQKDFNGAKSKKLAYFMTHGEHRNNIDNSKKKISVFSNSEDSGEENHNLKFDILSSQQGIEEEDRKIDKSQKVNMFSTQKRYFHSKDGKPGLSLMTYNITTMLLPKQNKTRKMKENEINLASHALSQIVIKRNRDAIKSSHNDTYRSLLSGNIATINTILGNMRRNKTAIPMRRKKRAVYDQNYYDRPYRAVGEYEPNQERDVRYTTKNRYYDQTEAPYYVNKGQRKEHYHDRFSLEDGMDTHYTTLRYRDGAPGQYIQHYTPSDRDYSYTMRYNRRVSHPARTYHHNKDYYEPRSREPIESYGPLDREYSHGKEYDRGPNHPTGTYRNRDYYSPRPYYYEPEETFTTRLPSGSTSTRNELYYRSPYPSYAPGRDTRYNRVNGQQHDLYTPRYATEDRTSSRAYLGHPRYPDAHTYETTPDEYNYPDPYEKAFFNLNVDRNGRPFNPAMDDRMTSGHSTKQEPGYKRGNNYERIGPDYSRGDESHSLTPDNSYTPYKDGRLLYNKYNDNSYVHKNPSSRGSVHSYNPKQYDVRYQDNIRGYRKDYSTKDDMGDRRYYEGSARREDNMKYSPSDKNSYKFKENYKLQPHYVRPEVTTHLYQTMNSHENRPERMEKNTITSSGMHGDIKTEVPHKQERSSRHNILFNGVYLPLGYRFSRLFQQTPGNDQITTESVAAQSKMELGKTTVPTVSRQANLHRSPKSIDYRRAYAYRRRTPRRYENDEPTSHTGPYQLYDNTASHNGYTSYRITGPYTPQVDYAYNNEMTFPPAGLNIKADQGDFYFDLPKDRPRETGISPEFYNVDRSKFRYSRRVKRQAPYGRAQNDYYSKTGRDPPHTIMVLTPTDNYYGNAGQHEQINSKGSPYQFLPTSQTRNQDLIHTLSSQNQLQNQYGYHEMPGTFYLPMTPKGPGYHELQRSPYQSPQVYGGYQRPTENAYTKDYQPNPYQYSPYSQPRNSYPFQDNSGSFYLREKQQNSGQYYGPGQNYMQMYPNVSHYSPIVMVPEYDQRRFAIDAPARTFKAYPYQRQKLYIPPPGNPYGGVKGSSYRSPAYQARTEHILDRHATQYDHQYYVQPKGSTPTVIVPVETSSQGCLPGSYDCVRQSQNDQNSYSGRSGSSLGSYNRLSDSRTAAYGVKSGTISLNYPRYAAQRKTRKYRTGHLTRHMTVKPNAHFSRSTSSFDTTKVGSERINTEVLDNNPRLPGERREVVQPHTSSREYEVNTIDKPFNEGRNPSLSGEDPRIVTFVLNRRHVDKPHFV